MDILHVEFPNLSQKALGIAIRKAYPNIRRIRPGSRKRRNVNHYYGITINKVHFTDKTNPFQTKKMPPKIPDDPRRRRQCSDVNKLSPHHHISLNLLTVGKEQIGRGTFGSCYKGTYRGMDVVVKNFKSFEENDVTKNALEREANVMLRLPQHQNLPFLFGIQNEKAPFSLVTQLYTVNGTPLTVRQALKVTSYASSNSISWNKIAYMCGDGLCVIHRTGILHNDLKGMYALFLNLHVEKNM